MIAQPSTTPPARRGAIARFFGGIACLGGGFRLWGTSPRLMVLGAVPAFIVGTVYTAAIVILAVNLAAVAGWVTPFADSFAPLWRDAVRAATGVGLMLASVLVAVFTFVALTLAVGEPFYERIWRDVERRAGQVPAELDEPVLRQLLRGIGNGVRLLGITGLLGVLLFVGGLIPLVGQSVVPVLGVGFGGWILALELTGFAFDARGFTVRQRRRMLRGNRAGALGFGIATYLLFLVPFAAVITMPAAVAGATVLARKTLAGTVPAGTLSGDPFQP